MDTNHDGIMSRDEIEHSFQLTDTNRDGVITKDEFRSLVNQEAHFSEHHVDKVAEVSETTSLTSLRISL